MWTSLKNSVNIIKMLPVYFFLLFILQITVSLDNITPNQSIRDGGNTLVSSGGSFELGFFSPGNSKNRYLGIWCKKVWSNASVWVANRETPLTDRSGFLNVTLEGVIVLFNGKNSVVWSSNKSRNAQNPVVQLLESGNLVVKDGNDNDPDKFLWQSFDHPCDTLLPGMKILSSTVIGRRRFLTSWKSADDPAQGQFSWWIDPRGFPQIILSNGTSFRYRMGSWNGLRFTGTVVPVPFLYYEFVVTENEVYSSFEVQGSQISRLWLSPSGFAERFGPIFKANVWEPFASLPHDPCDSYSVCGAYAKCHIINNSPNCSCLEGFKYETPKKGSKDCVRKTPLDCKNEVFQIYKGLKLPDTSYSWYSESMSLAECKEMCSRNCSCTAYANSKISEGGSGCLLWFTDLIDMRELPIGGQDLFIKMSSKAGPTKMQVGLIVSSAILTGMLMVGLIFYVWNKKYSKQESRRRKVYYNKDRNEDMELPIFNLTTIVKATENFSSDNKLGEGGFGPVYKGTLIDGKEIAVKRLSKSSGQGMTEFKNEVLFIAKLQHKNLVKLLGCCIQEDEKMLIYEFMPNKSLDSFIFDETRRKLLHWHKRIFIIDGIARGLLYLHHDSRLRIIHRDLKASNVLLDENMNPKISDFGLARMFGGDQTEAETRKVVGTYGYMSPEYAVDGLFSMKSDVFSFGVLVLEVVSGKKNRGFSHPDHGHNLIGHAWKLWIEGRALELVDNMLDDSYVVSQVLRCIHVGLLCVQQRPEDRPNMSSVILMMGSESSLPQPKQPGYFTEGNMPEAECSLKQDKSSSVNEVTITLPEAR